MHRRYTESCRIYDPLIRCHLRRSETIKLNGFNPPTGEPFKKTTDTPNVFLNSAYKISLDQFRVRSISLITNNLHNVSNKKKIENIKL